MGKVRRTEQHVEEMIDELREAGHEFGTNSKLDVGVEEVMLKGGNGAARNGEETTLCLDDLGRFVSYVGVNEWERRSYGWTLQEELLTGRLIPANVSMPSQDLYDGGSSQEAAQEASQETGRIDLRKLTPEQIDDIVRQLRFQVDGQVVTVMDLLNQHGLELDDDREE